MNPGLSGLKLDGARGGCSWKLYVPNFAQGLGCLKIFQENDNELYYLNKDVTNF